MKTARVKTARFYCAGRSIAAALALVTLLCLGSGAAAQQNNGGRPVSGGPARHSARGNQNAPRYRAAQGRRAGVPRRPSSDPVRFVFAPKKTQLQPGDDPSALAIWSTLFTGNMSPEIVQWHINQRQRQMALRRAEQSDPAEAARIREEMREEKLSDYDRMLARTHFSLSSYSEEEQDLNPDGPASSAVLAQLLTGRSNRQIQQWKQRRESELYNDLFNDEELFDTGAADPGTMLAGTPYGVGYPAANAPNSQNNSYNGSAPYNSDYHRGYQAGLYAALASGIVNPDAADPRRAAVENFRPAPAQPAPTYSAPSSRMQANSSAPAVPTARPLADDGFPNRVIDTSGAIRPVSGAEPAAPAVQPADWITDNRPVNRPGTMKVYTPEKNNVTARPLAEAPDEDSWMPVEP
ncbi:MAG: hypothetical protein IJH68_09755 [Thermoguttaceae bacterium]|nr:hypothetical protein [Thermoguttaceae bacterium]